jgi:hypothetical protein
MIRFNFLLAGLLSFSMLSMTQGQAYKLLENLAYYPSTNTDPYVRERCRLDVYFPVDKKNFQTVVWFHSGVLSGGEKHIPDAPQLVLITGDRELEMLGRYEENAYLMRMMKVSGHTKTTLYELQGYDHGMVEPAIPILLKVMVNN